MDPDEAVEHVEAMARARELLGLELEAPSQQLQSRVFRAAFEQHASVTWKRGIDDDGRVAYWAIFKTARGEVSERVTTTWEDAWRATGLLD